jgi:poly-beta-1,6-N-acetyl-D-glucosamine synthase
MFLEGLGFALAALHFGMPLTYFACMKNYTKKPWNIAVDEKHTPKISVIVPTFREEEFINEKLGDLYAQDYDKNLLEVIVVDDFSDDQTSHLAEQWISDHHDFNVKLIQRTVHQGKLSCLNEAINEINPLTDLIVLTDADAFWDRNALSRAGRYFADAKVGSVTCCIVYVGPKVSRVENEYRNYYNILRVAESKRQATPIQNGPLLAIRARILKHPGFPNYRGSDDSVFGSFVAFMGYRAIQADDVFVREPTRGSNFRRKVRRANRLVQNFLKTKRYARSVNAYVKSSFDDVWRVEWWLHIVNPWFLVASVGLLMVSAVFYGSTLAVLALFGGLLLLVQGAYRMWIGQQLYLIVARLWGLRTKDVTWKR